MAKINKFNVKLSWTPSESVDVVGYKLYFDDDPEYIDYQCQYYTEELITSTTFMLNKETKGISGFPELTSNTLYVGVVSVDKAGNESDIVVKSVTLDTTPPLPVTNFFVELVNG